MEFLSYIGSNAAGSGGLRPEAIINSPANRTIAYNSVRTIGYTGTTTHSTTAGQSHPYTNSDACF